MGLSIVRRPAISYDARGLVKTHGRRKPVRGVWHSTECGDAAGISELEGIVAYWRRQNLGYGAHVIVDKDGLSAMCANPSEICWAVEGRNTGTFSVEMVGYAKFTPKLWWLRQKQLREVARWMAWLNVEYNVPLTFDVEHGWSRHLDQSRVFGGSHTDPGRGFPMGYVLRLARRYRRDGW